MSKKHVDFAKGLTSELVRKRLSKFGPNEFEEKREFSAWKLLLTQFRSPLIYVLVAAGLVTLALHEWLDAGIIFLVVLSNTALGFWQEFKAAKSLEALKGYLKPKVTVLRDGVKQEVLMKELVPGDLVYLDAGGSVPADGVVVAAEMMTTNEALLTGESRPVEKKVGRSWRGEPSITEIEVPNTHDKLAREFVYMGTTVSSGVGEMVVVRTGVATEMGKIAKSLTETKEELTPLQLRIAGLARNLMIVVVMATVLIFLIGLWRGENWLEMLETSVAIAVAAIPEGLAVSMTVILALGMQRIFRRKALVRKLVAAETLGSVSVICSDKTGTITEGKMRLVDFAGNRDGLLRGAILANDERDEEGRAMVGWAESQLAKKGVGWSRGRSVTKLRRTFPRLSSIPFDSAYKYMAVLNQSGRGSVISVVGAPDVLLGKCKLGRKEKAKVTEEIEKLASGGYRLIGVASKKSNKKGELKKSDVENLKWEGLLVFADPIRKHVKQALEQAQAAGIEVKVITGDYRETAIAILKQLWGDKQALDGDLVVTGEELRALSGKKLEERIKKAVLFARTTPDQKLTIVKVLKKQHQVVAMTGDGVNDAPALKAADIGVVVNEASDVSKQTADMVLLNSNFRTIVEAVREGRVIFQTMRKVVVYLVSTAFQEIFLIGGSLLLGLPLPLSAIQILWINLVEDGLPGVALAFDTVDEGVMSEKPRKKSEGLVDAEGRLFIGVVAVVANAFLLVMYYWLTQVVNLGGEYVRTMVFVGLGTNTLMFTFSIRSLKTNLWHEDVLDNKFLLYSVIFGLVLMGLSISWPPLMGMIGVVALEWQHLALVLVINVLTLGIIEGLKYWYNNRHRAVEAV